MCYAVLTSEYEKLTHTHTRAHTLAHSVPTQNNTRVLTYKHAQMHTHTDTKSHTCRQIPAGTNAGTHTKVALVKEQNSFGPLLYEASMN